MDHGKNAVMTVFALQGAVFGSWAPRVPAIAEHVHADTGSLGLALLGSAVGMITAALMAGRFCARFGARLLVLLSGLVMTGILPLVAVVPTTVSLGLILVLLGASADTLDVAMNIAAVTVIRTTERPLMPVFHAAYSFGGLAGAAGAAAAAAMHLVPAAHFTVVSAVGIVILLAVVRRVPNEPAVTEKAHQPASTRAMARRPVLWLIAAIALCSAVAEGASADWSALFAVRERGLGESAAALVFAGFSIAMAVTRLVGEHAERRFGAYRLLVAGALTAGGGLLLAVLVPAGWAGYVGFALAGAGVAYAFPIALDLAGAAGRRPDGSGGERELGFVTAIAYSGFLAGPPMIGGIAQLTNLAVALGFAGLIAALIAPAALAAAAARRKEAQDQEHAEARTLTHPQPGHA